jgi:hypothetical protein
MKRTLSLICLLSLSGAFGLEQSMLSLKLPSQLDARQAQFFFQHRFYGKVDSLDTFFGMAEGANAGLGFRIRVFRNFELVASHVFGEERENENSLGIGYAFPVPGLPVRGQIDAEIFSNKRYYTDPNGAFLRRKNFTAVRLDLASKAILNRLTPVVNIGYNSERKHAGFGLGLDVTITPKYSLIGEYYPRLQKTRDESLLIHDSFAIGLKVQTYGHHFLFHVGNNRGIGTRNLMEGAGVKTLFFGFGIQRLLEF